MAKKKTRAAEPLEFFKYDPATDGDQTFNIDLALNENWDKVKSKFDSQDTEIESIKSEVENIDVSWSGISGKPESFPPSTHTHDDRYYTESEVNNLLNAKANSTHTHTKSQITDFPTSLPANGGNADTLDGLHASSFASSNHTHTVLTGGQNSTINIGTGNDCSGLSTTNNIDIKSWYGVSFSNSCTNAGITGRPTASIDVRSGTMYLESDLYVGGMSVRSALGQSGIKSVQRGTYHGAVSGYRENDVGYIDITISPVNVNKAFVIYYGSYVIDSSNRSPNAKLINSTTLRLFNEYGGNSIKNGNWQVIEFY